MPDPTVPSKVAWWSLAPAAAAQKLEVDLDKGLSADEARRRLAEYGPNELAAQAGKSKLRLFLGQFADLMIGLLAVAALISGVVGDWSDSVLIFAIVLANAVIGFLQELRAEQAVAALKKLSRPQARVLRDGRLVDLPAAAVVPGDVVELTSGDLAPADGRLVQVVDLQTDEAPLTGESHWAEKQIEALTADTALPERANMAFAGTAVGQGRGRLLITATGMRTELGKIAELLETAESGPTPLQERLSSLSRRLAVAVVIVCIAVFVAGIVRGAAGSWSEMLLAAVSLAVAAIPEGLPAVITIALALGSQRMARRKAIVRQLSAVETLGSVNVICSDKTGTLTQNKMTVREKLPASDDPAAVDALLQAAALCNNAEWSAEHGALGSATETALVQAAADHGLEVADVRRRWPRIHEIPFSSARKRMTTIHQTPAGDLLAIMKGAAEFVLQHCEGAAAGERASTLDEGRRRKYLDQAAELAARGQRVLGFAQRRLDAGALRDDPRPERIERDFEFLGYLAIIDPLRDEAKAAIEQCRSAGIAVVMITGDHQATATAIARELGLDAGEGRVLAGLDLDRVDDEGLRRRVNSVTVYARVSPEHKLRIVRAHQAQGSVAAMTGDGVNDAPALKQADIGVAMGITGTDVSKEAANMVLADDNFATIVAAVEEGRVVYDNIRKFVRYLLTSNTSEILVLLLAILIGLPLPLLPIHLLWINLVTDGLPALALGYEPAEPGTMRRKPRRREESIFAGGMAWEIGVLGMLMALSTLGVYWAELAPSANRTEADLDYARTAAFVTLSLFQLFYVLGLRSTEQSLWARGLFSNWRLTAAVAAGGVLQVAIVYVPVLQRIFHTASLEPRDLALGIGVSTLSLVAVEIAKAWRRRTVRHD
ncbi:MAG: cation-transporting P-type ATPase [Pirellulales bacterium]